MTAQDAYDKLFQQQHDSHTGMDDAFRSDELAPETPEQRFERDTESTLRLIALAILGNETDRARIYVERLLALVDERSHPAFYTAGIFFKVDGLRKLSKTNLQLVCLFFAGWPIYRGGSEYRLHWDGAAKSFVPVRIRPPR